MKGHHGFFGERNGSVSRIDRVTGIFDLRHRCPAAGIDDSYPAYFLVRLPGSLHQLALSREHLILIDVAQFADNLILRAGRVAGTLHINDVVLDELSALGSIQPTRHEVGIGQDLPVNETSAVNICVGGHLHPLDREADRRGGRPGWRDGIRCVDLQRRLRPRCRCGD